MNVLTSLDTIVNFVPRTPSRAIMHMGNGKEYDGLTYLPISVVAYMMLSAGQGAAVGYGVYVMSGNLKHAITSATVGAIMPSIIWAVRGLRDIHNSFK